MYNNLCMSGGGSTDAKISSCYWINHMWPASLLLFPHSSLSPSLRCPPCLLGAFGPVGLVSEVDHGGLEYRPLILTCLQSHPMCLCVFSLGFLGLCACSWLSASMCLSLCLSVCVIVCLCVRRDRGGFRGGQMVRGLLSSGALWLPKIRRKQLEHSVPHSALPRRLK